MPRRTFTLDEANALLEQVRPLAQRLVECRADLLAVGARRAELATRAGGNGGGLTPHAAAELAETGARAETGLRQAVHELLELGVLVKDLDAGLVDFPSIRDGEEVLLCWQLGEESIGWWHGYEDGFAGRKPL